MVTESTACVVTHPAARHTGDVILLAVITAFLRIGRHVDRCALAIMLASLTMALVSPPLHLAAFIATACGLAVLEKYFAVRVELDVALFTVLQRCADNVGLFDQALQTCTGRATTPGRSITSRWRGARRLLAWQTTTALLQAGVLAAATAL